jgi:hypothetical protein
MQNVRAASKHMTPSTTVVEENQPVVGAAVVKPPVLVVVASKLSPAEVLQGITSLVSQDAPVIVQTFPSPNVVMGVEFGVLGLEIMTQIANMIQAMHKKKA